MKEIEESLKSVVKQLFGLTEVPVVVTVADGQRMTDGAEVDYASNVAMQLARVAHQAPGVIAKRIVEALSQELFGRAEVEVAGPGFLNFRMVDDYYWTEMQEMKMNLEQKIKMDSYANQVVVCEFSDPNPFKVLHVGHLYTSVVGDAMSRLVEWAGGRVVRANFGGDVGLHVAKTMYVLQRKKTEEITPEELAECYVKGTQLYEDDVAAKEEITALNKQIYEIAEGNLHGFKLADLYWKGREVSYEYFEDFYAKIGVKFDKFYPESTVARRGLTVVQEQLENGVYEVSDGAVVFKGEKYGLHTRVFINKEGLPTYETKDVGLLFTKNDDYNFDKSIVITGNDIIEYMKVVLKSVEQYAPELVKKAVHITHGNVRLPGNEKMSSRKGNFIRAVDVLAQVEEILWDATGGRDEAAEETFKQIGLGAIKYAFLKYRVGGNIEFDAKSSVAVTGNSGVYLQYAAVRAKKVLAMATEIKKQQEKYIMNESERALAKQLVQYKNVLQEAVAELAPHKICGYLYELAQEFSRFYEKVKVVGNEHEAERLVLVENYLQIMEHGLGLLGIAVPEEM